MNGNERYIIFIKSLFCNESKDVYKIKPPHFVYNGQYKSTSCKLGCNRNMMEF